MSGQTFSAGVPVTGTQLTAIVYQNDDGISNVTGAGTTTSASYANLPATSSFSFTKKLTATRLKVTGHLVWVSVSNSSKCGLGALVNGTDYDLVAGLAGSGAALGIAGSQYVSGLAAGTYTIQGRWKRVSGAGTPTVGTDQWISLCCSEVT